MRTRPLTPSPLPTRLRGIGFGLAVGAALLVPLVVGPKLIAYQIALTQVVLFVSLHLLVRTSGQISLCHFGFAAVGASGFGHSLGSGIPFAVALLLGGLACVPLALIISVPAIRLSGLYLALATLGFGIVLSQYAYAKPYMFGAGQLVTRKPAGFDSDERYYYLLLALAAAAVGLVLLVERSRLGRLLRAMSDSPLALTMLGTSVNVSRVLVFCLSGFLAGISGALFASLFGSVNQDAFTYVQSLLALAVLALAGRRTITAAFLGPVLLYVVPVYIDNETLALVLQLLFGLGAIAAAALSQGGLAGFLGRSAERHTSRATGPGGRRRALASPTATEAVPSQRSEQLTAGARA